MVKAPRWTRPLFRREYRLVSAFEATCYKWFVAHFIISEQDRLALAFPGAEAITLLPNGVDTVRFSPQNVNKKYDIAFVGNMNYPPNIDSACFLVREIMPLVWKEILHAKVVIAGANPHPKVRSLESDRVVVSGWIDDIRECYSSTRVFVAPMRMGTGLQNKLLEAMAMGIASVTTPISAAPLGADAGKDILVGSSAEELSVLITGLLKDEVQRASVAHNGRNFVTRIFSLRHASDMLNRELEHALKTSVHG
jgi:glycosyltransferase involved in cell wall biosynthesis